MYQTIYPIYRILCIVRQSEILWEIPHSELEPDPVPCILSWL